LFEDDFFKKTDRRLMDLYEGGYSGNLLGLSTVAMTDDFLVVGK